MFKLVVLPFLFAAVAAAPAGLSVPGISTTVVENGPLLRSYGYGPVIAGSSGIAGLPAVGLRSVIAQGPSFVSAPATYQVAAPAAVELRAAAPAVAVAAAPAVAVAAPVTKTVHYETRPVVTGYSTQVIKAGPNALLTDPAIVRQEKVLAPARPVTRITPQITQVQPEVNIQRVAVDVPVAQPIAVPTPVVNEVQYTAPAVEVVRAAPAAVQLNAAHIQVPAYAGLRTVVSQGPAVISAPNAVELRSGPSVIAGHGLVSSSLLNSWGSSVYAI